MQVQNKLAQATPLLPEAVQRQGVTVEKSSAGFLMVIGMISPDGTFDQTDLADYLVSNMVDEFSRIEGVGSIQVFGGQYAMRIWLDPDKLAAYELAPSDVIAAVAEENAQISAGAFGTRPTLEGQQLNASRRPGWRSAWPPGRTRSTPRRGSRNGWPSSRSSSPRA